MYGEAITATIQDYSSCPVDDEHQRQQRLQLKLTGDLDPSMFADVDAEVQQDVARCNEGRKDSVAYPMRRRASMVVAADGEQRDFAEVELTAMAFKRPAKNKDRGSWALTVAFDWSDEDLLFIAHAHRLVASVQLIKLEEPPAAQATLEGV